MIQLYYTLCYLLRIRGNNLIKIFSLALGLFVGLILVAQVAFKLSFDNFYPDADRIYQLRVSYNTEAGRESTNRIQGPIPDVMKEELQEVENATVVFLPFEISYFHDNIRYRCDALHANTSFFDVFGFELLRGDARALSAPSSIFVSETFAKRIFGNNDPVGEILYQEKRIPYTIKGIFKDIPENCHLSKFDVLVSFANVSDQLGLFCGWNGGDSFWGYVKLLPGMDVTTVENKAFDVLSKYMDVTALQSMNYKIHLTPVRQIYSSNPDVLRMVLILSILAFVILFMASMNYILIAISSLPNRAKSVGMHKCSGASEMNILVMFMYETALIILTALGVGGILLFAFRTQVEEMTGFSIKALFAGDHLWIVWMVVLVLFVVTALVPGQLFSSLPVTQLFHSAVRDKRRWKQALLFVQFAGVAFVFVFLIFVIAQYHRVIHKDMGYDTENLFFVKDNELSKTDGDYLKHELMRMPCIESVTSSSDFPWSLSGFPVYDSETGEYIFSVRNLFVDANYFDVMRIKLKNGGVFDASKTTRERQYIVNEAMVKMMNWKDNPVGKTIRTSDNFEGKVVGIVNDFRVESFYFTQSPLVIEPLGESTGLITFRMKKTSVENLKMVVDRLSQLFPDRDMPILSYREVIYSTYESERLFRNFVIGATWAILFITWLGLCGYINDEAASRRKEIAIRKVNGASVADILKIISKDILQVALPAVGIGLVFSYLVAQHWLQQFAERISLHWGIFFTGGILVIAVILFSIICKTWYIANENPVGSLNKE